jgi:hypothetical protein
MRRHELNLPFGGPAFPFVFDDGRQRNVYTYTGMTLRDYFAAKAMQQLMPMVSNDPRTLMPLDFDVANMAYQMADAMLKAREE